MHRRPIEVARQVPPKTAPGAAVANCPIVTGSDSTTSIRGSHCRRLRVGRSAVLLSSSRTVVGLLPASPPRLGSSSVPRKSPSHCALPGRNPNVTRCDETRLGLVRNCRSAEAMTEFRGVTVDWQSFQKTPPSGPCQVIQSVEFPDLISKCSRASDRWLARSFLTDARLSPWAKASTIA